MNTNNPAYVSRAGLAQRFGWFKQMDKMMQDCYTADTAALITMPSLEHADDDNIDMDNYSDIGPDHAGHSQELPPLLDIVGQNQSATASAASVASATAASATTNALDNNTAFDTNLFPASQLTPGPTSGASMLFSPEASLPSSAQSSSATKRKRGASKKRDSLADTYYHSTVEVLKIKLQLEQERRRWVEVSEQERTKCMEMRMKDQEEKCKQEEHLKAQDRDLILQIVCMLAARGEDPSTAAGASH